jgi:prepilin-type N-terminal cleavage/methylation domain-containing protein
MEQKNKQGFSIIEIIVAMGIFLLIAVSAVTTILGSFSTNRLGEEETTAYLFALEGMEAAKSIRNQGWNSPFLTTNCSSGCGIANNAGVWQWNGSNNTSGKYTRNITVSDVRRNGSGAIVESGGTLDANAKKITSSVTWNFTPTRSNTVSLYTYVTNFLKQVTELWAGITKQGAVDLSGTNNGIKVKAAGNYAYVIRDAAASPDFFVVNISDPANPSVVGSLDVNGVNLSVSGNFVYIVSAASNPIFRVINVSNPASPQQVASLNASGGAAGRGIYVAGNYAYLTRTNSGQPEFYVFNITNPNSPSQVGTVNLTGNPNEVVVLGNYAYLASDNDTQELQVINVTNPSSPSLAGSLDLTNTYNGITIDGFSSTVVLGRDTNGLMHMVNVSNPTAPSLLGTYTAGNAIQDIAIGNSNTNAFLATSNSTGEFRVVKISDTANPSLIASYDAVDILNGVAYLDAQALSIVVGNSDNEELIILSSQ